MLDADTDGQQQCHTASVLNADANPTNPEEPDHAIVPQVTLDRKALSTLLVQHLSKYA